VLELSEQQLAVLAQIDARGYVERIRQDLVQEHPALAHDGTLFERLWRAYAVARQLRISTDENVAAFLRLEAFSPGFHEKPPTRNWLTRPGRSGDSRFHDYLCVIRWRIERPEFKGELANGRTGTAHNRSGSGSAWASIGARWSRLIGRNNGSGNS
jgi:hypothetical protein